jgi:glycosyltransferase involved in cell wall biosynthesis
MRLLQVTNLVSPHQLPLAKALAAAVGADHFRLAATLPMTVEMGRRGWTNNESEPWILRAGEVETDRDALDAWWREADVVIAGVRDLPRFKDRIRQGKLTFYMSERWWKPPIGMARLLHPGYALRAFQMARLAKSSSLHFLSIGGFALSDLNRVMAFPCRAWEWGYFISSPDPIPPCREREGRLRVLWAGRMLDWKRVDTLLEAVARVKGQGVGADLTIIGHGPCEARLRGLAEALGISEQVAFLPSVPAPVVREYMRQADVYVLPSSDYEGWGAVLNEAMAEGCAVICSDGVGAAKPLLRHGENGLIFPAGDAKALADLLIRIQADEPYRRRLSAAGQQSLLSAWTPEVAAARFLGVAEALHSGTQIPSYAHGPMSPARAGNL